MTVQTPEDKDNGRERNSPSGRKKQSGGGCGLPLETDSEPKVFIKKFGAEKGLTVPVLETIWQARKHGYHKPFDVPFAKFRAFFDEYRPLCPFRPDTMQPGDVIGFLRHMHEEGSNHGSIKDASASISTAISQVTDGAINIGKKESVIAYLKSVRIHQPVGPRHRRIPDGYGDIARLYEEAWSFGPNDALCNRHLQDKLVLLLMLDTAARPSDLLVHALYRVTEGSQRQILFNGKYMQIRYFYSKEVDGSPLGKAKFVEHILLLLGPRVWHGPHRNYHGRRHERILAAYDERVTLPASARSTTTTDVSTTSVFHFTPRQIEGRKCGLYITHRSRCDD